MKKITVLFCAVLIVFALLVTPVAAESAGSFVHLSVTGTKVNVRDAANTSGKVLTQANPGDAFIADGEPVTNSDGSKWYKIVLSVGNEYVLLAAEGRFGVEAAYISANFVRTMKLHEDEEKKIAVLLAGSASVSTPAGDGSNYVGVYFYEYEYNSDDLTEDHYIVIENVNGRIVGRYYGTSDDFDDAREGYTPGFFVADMNNLQIKDGSITFEIFLSEDDMFSRPVDLKYKSGNQVPKSENPLWENNQIVTNAAENGKNPREYKGKITNGDIILETGGYPSQRVFKKIAGNAA